jgi:hypothetical protein
VPEILIDVSYVAPQAHDIVNVALHREYPPGIVFIFSHQEKVPLSCLRLTQGISQATTTRLYRGYVNWGLYRGYVNWGLYKGYVNWGLYKGYVNWGSQTHTLVLQVLRVTDTHTPSRETREKGQLLWIYSSPIYHSMLPRISNHLLCCLLCFVTTITI